MSLRKVFLVIEILAFLASAGAFYLSMECLTTFSCDTGYVNAFSWYPCEYSTLILIASATILFITAILYSISSRKSKSNKLEDQEAQRNFLESMAEKKDDDSAWLDKEDEN